MAVAGQSTPPREDGSRLSLRCNSGRVPHHTARTSDDSRHAVPPTQPACGAATRCRRDRSLVVLYHRILPDGTAPGAIVPALQRQFFVRQLKALLRVGNIVPLRQLLEPSRRGQRPRIALTFDDDHAGYVGTVVPELQALGVPATFFLSGRSLHGSSLLCTRVSRACIHGLDYTVAHSA